MGVIVLKGFCQAENAQPWGWAADGETRITIDSG